MAGQAEAICFVAAAARGTVFIIVILVFIISLLLSLF